MIGKNTAYILNLRNIKEKDLDLVGREAIENSLIIREGIPTPMSFIVTSSAFDDFLTASDLVDPISKALKEVRPFIKHTAKDASDKITRIINAAQFPTILERPIIESYRNLSHIEQPFVTVQASNIIDPKFVPNTQNDHVAVNIRGEKALLDAIKKAWSSLFSIEAIELRTNGYYQGPISTGVVIQKMVRSEISGRVYSVAPNTFDQSIIEIHAIYGINNENIDITTNADIYKLDKKTGKFIEKTIIPQDYMLVRRGKANENENPDIQVEISHGWKKQQKVDDNRILRIGLGAKRLENLLNTPIEISWGIEAGELYFFIVKEIDMPKAKLQTKSLESTRIDTNEPKEDIAVDRFAKKSEPKKEKPNFNNLIREVKAIVSGEKELVFEHTKIKPLDKPLFEDQDEIIPNVILPNTVEKTNTEEKKIQQHYQYDPIPVEKVTTNYETITPLYLDISKMNSGVLTSLNNFKGAYYNGTEMVLNNNVLPEEIKSETHRLSEMVERYSVDITTAAKSTNGNLIYLFSNITEVEWKLLDIAEGKYKYTSDERFIDHPEALIVEAFAVKKARNLMGSRNIHICFPAVRNMKNLMDLKQIVSLQGLRRTASLKMYAEVAIPSLIFELSKLEKNDIDGLIINYDRLLRLSVFRSQIREVDHNVVLEQIKMIQLLSRDKKLEIYINLSEVAFQEKIIKELILLKPTGLIFKNAPPDSIIGVIKNTEDKNPIDIHLDDARKPGRKIKELL